MKITAVYITYNQYEKLRLSLFSLIGVVDEVVLLDSFSTDDTPRLIEEFKGDFLCFTYQNKKFEGYVSQKNAANDLVKTPYILSLDSDELLDETAQKEILNWKKKASHNEFISFKRLNFIGQTPIRYGSWQKDTKIRLFPQKTRWQENLVHESLTMPTIYAKKRLNGNILHYTADNLNAISVKSEQYAQLGGKVKSSKSWLSLYFSIAFSPLVKWLKGYIWLQGFRLGLLGWDLEKTLALETFKKYKYAIQYKKRFN